MSVIETTTNTNEIEAVVDTHHDWQPVVDALNTWAAETPMAFRLDDDGELEFAGGRDERWRCGDGDDEIGPIRAVWDLLEQIAGGVGYGFEQWEQYTWGLDDPDEALALIAAWPTADEIEAAHKWPDFWRPGIYGNWYATFRVEQLDEVWCRVTGTRDDAIACGDKTADAVTPDLWLDDAEANGWPTFSGLLGKGLRPRSLILQLDAREAAEHFRLQGLFNFLVDRDSDDELEDEEETELRKILSTVCSVDTYSTEDDEPARGNWWQFGGLLFRDAEGNVVADLSAPEVQP